MGGVGQAPPEPLCPRNAAASCGAPALIPDGLPEEECRDSRWVAGNGLCCQGLQELPPSHGLSGSGGCPHLCDSVPWSVVCTHHTGRRKVVAVMKSTACEAWAICQGKTRLYSEQDSFCFMGTASWE